MEDLRTRARRAIAALDEPAPQLARVPNTLRQSIREVIEELLVATDTPRRPQRSRQPSPKHLRRPERRRE